MRLAFAFVLASTASTTGCLDIGDEIETSETESELVTTAWADDVQVPNQQSARQVGLAYYGGALHMVHAGSASPSELWWSKYNGVAWSTNVRISGQAASSATTLASFSGRLYMAYRSGNSMLVSSTSGTSWTTPVVAIGQGAHASAGYTWTTTPRGAPSLAVHGTSLYLAHCVHHSGELGDYDRVVVRRLEGSTWTQVTTVSLNAECSGVSLSSFGGRLHVIHNELWSVWPYTQTVLHETTFDPANVGGTYVTDVTSMHSARPASVAVCGGYAYLVHSGDDSPSEIWASTRSVTGNTWANEIKVNTQTSNSGATVGCYGTRAVMVHNGGTNQLWFAKHL